MGKIYLGLTTIWGSDWREKIREIDSLGISELALFPTVLEPEERKEFYNLLKKSTLKKAPFVHLRTDMERWEIDFFIERYGAEVFNIHPGSEAIEFLKMNNDLNSMIYTENCLDMSNYEKTLALSAGICLDISHYEDFAIRQNTPGQEKFKELLNEYTVGCSHLSAIKEKKYKALTHGEELLVYESHTLDNFSEMEYIKQHKQYLGKYSAIELSNSLKEQIKIKEYLEKILA